MYVGNACVRADYSVRRTTASTLRSRNLSMIPMDYQPASRGKTHAKVVPFEQGPYDPWTNEAVKQRETMQMKIALLGAPEHRNDKPTTVRRPGRRKLCLLVCNLNHARCLAQDWLECW